MVVTWTVPPEMVRSPSAWMPSSALETVISPSCISIAPPQFTPSSAASMVSVPPAISTSPLHLIPLLLEVSPVSASTAVPLLVRVYVPSVTHTRDSAWRQSPPAVTAALPSVSCKKPFAASLSSVDFTPSLPAVTVRSAPNIATQSLPFTPSSAASTVIVPFTSFSVSLQTMPSRLFPETARLPLPLIVSLSCANRAQASTLFPLSVVSALSALSVKTFFVPFASDRTVRFSLTHTSAGPDGLVISAPSR